MIVPEVHFDCPHCGTRLGVVYTPDMHGAAIGRIERTGICGSCRKGVGINLEVDVGPVPEENLHPEGRDLIAQVVRKKFDGTPISPNDLDHTNVLRCFSCGLIWHSRCMNGDVLSCPSCHEEESRLQQVDQTSEIHKARHKPGCPYDKRSSLEAPQE